MKNLRILIFSFITLTIFSCSEENNQGKEEIAVLKTTAENTKKTATADCGTKTTIVASDASYNCFGLAFSLSETGIKVPLDNAEIYSAYIASGIFKEDNSSNASKVLYWNNLADYNAKDYRAIDHAAILVDGGNNVYSKEGLIGLYRNCINYHYLHNDIIYYRTYSLNVDLTKPTVAPKRGETFTVALQHDASALEVQYIWEYDTNNIELVSGNGISQTFKVKDNAVTGSYSVTLKATHQRGIINSTSFPKVVSSKYTFSLASNTPTASFTGSTYVTKTNMGSWSATASGGTPGYTYSWWLKRHEDPESFYLMVGNGSSLYLLTKTSIKSFYYDLYLRVTDSNNKSFTTQPLLIQATGILEEAY